MSVTELSSTPLIRKSGMQVAEEQGSSTGAAETASFIDENISSLPMPLTSDVCHKIASCSSPYNNHDDQPLRSEGEAVNVEHERVGEAPVFSSPGMGVNHAVTNGASSSDEQNLDGDEVEAKEDSADGGADADECEEQTPTRRSSLRDRSKLNKPTTWSDELVDFSQPDIMSGNYVIKDGLVYNKVGHVLMTAERFLQLSSSSNSPRRPMRRARNRVEIEEQQKKSAEASAKKQQAEERRLKKEELENSRKEREQLMLEREKLKLEQLKLKEQDRLRRESEKAAKLIQTEETVKKKKEEQERKQKEKCQRDEEEAKKRAEKDKIKLAEQEAVRKQQQILQAFVKKLPSQSQPLSQPKTQSALGFSTTAALCDGIVDSDADIVPIGFFHHNDTVAAANKQSTYLGPFFDVKLQALISKAAQDDFVSMLSIQSGPSAAASSSLTFLDEISAQTRRYTVRKPIFQRPVRDIDRFPDLLDGFRNKTGAQIEPQQVRMKLFKFFEEYRPGFYGTKINACSNIITPRDPFRKDTRLLDYDVDSDDEWDLGIEPDMEVDECSDAESTTGDDGTNNKRTTDAGAADGDDDDESDEEGFVIRDEDAWKTENALGVTFNNFFTNSGGGGNTEIAALASRFDLSMKYYNNRTKKGKPEKRVPRLMGPFYAEMENNAAELKDASVSAFMPYFSRLAAISWTDPETNELGVACRVKQSQSNAQSSSSQQPGSSQSQAAATKVNPAKMTRAYVAAAVEEEDEAELKVLEQQQRQKLIVDENGNVIMMDTSSTTLMIASDGVMNVDDDDGDAEDGGNAEEVERLTAEDKEELVEIYEQCTRQACVARTGSDWRLTQRERRGKLRREAKQQAIARGLKWPQPNEAADSTTDSRKASSWASSGFVDGNESDDEDFVLAEKDDAEEDDDDDSSTVEEVDDSSSDDEKEAAAAVAGSPAGNTVTAVKKREPKLTQQTLSLVKKSAVVQRTLLSSNTSSTAVSKKPPPVAVDDDDSVMEVEPSAPLQQHQQQKPGKSIVVENPKTVLCKTEKSAVDNATVCNNNSPLRGRKATRMSESHDELEKSVAPVDDVTTGKADTNTDKITEEAAMSEPKPKKRRIQTNKID